MQHQRLVLAAAVLLSQSEMGPTGPNRQVRDFSWEDHVRYMTDAEFKLRYRVSWESFGELLRIVEPGLSVANELQAIKFRSGTTTQNNPKHDFGKRLGFYSSIKI